MVMFPATPSMVFPLGLMMLVARLLAGLTITLSPTFGDAGSVTVVAATLVRTYSLNANAVCAVVLTITVGNVAGNSNTQRVPSALGSVVVDPGVVELRRYVRKVIGE